MATKTAVKKSAATRKSTSLFFKSFYEFVPVGEVKKLRPGLRGIYALYQEDENKFLNLAYVGMTGGGAKGRLGKHAESKSGLWSHCSVYEVWDNITRDQIAELEALFRHALRRDAIASTLNIQKGSSVFRQLKRETSQHSAV